MAHFSQNVYLTLFSYDNIDYGFSYVTHNGHGVLIDSIYQGYIRTKMKSQKTKLGNRMKGRVTVSYHW